MAEDKNKLTNEAGKDGLILASAAIVFFLISHLLGKIENGGFLLTALGFVLWVAKFTLCIWLMFAFLRKFAATSGKDRSKTFRFGVTIALCSSLVYEGFYLLYVSVIAPDFFKGVFDALAQAYSGILTTADIDRIMNMESSMPTISFFTNLIWCSLIGIVISAIASGRICGSDDPFANEN